MWAWLLFQQFALFRKYHFFAEEVRDNVTESVLSFVPTLEDDGKPLVCRAQNPNVSSLFLETAWTVRVVYPPVVRLRLGASLAAADIKEGDDVYFECHVRANPPATKLSWLHDERPLAHNASARVLHSNQSLVLQSVTRAAAGRYACAALNAEGETVSNHLHFRVKYAPRCRAPGVSVVGAARGEAVVIVCEVDADPPAAVFKWKFNNSGETIDVAAHRYTSNGSASSLKYTPVADLDYGTLSCSAANEVGSQLAPCVFQMVAAGKPHAPKNCSVWNQTAESVEVSCAASFDGGLPQRFLLEVYQGDSAPRMNLSSWEPAWTVRGLEWDVRFRLWAVAVNDKGRSPPAVVDDVLFRDPERRTATPRALGVGGVVAGAGCAGAVALLVVGAARWWGRWGQRGGGEGAEGGEPIKPPPHTKHEHDDTEPDLIPNNYCGEPPPAPLLVPLSAPLVSPLVTPLTAPLVAPLVASPAATCIASLPVNTNNNMVSGWSWVPEPALDVDAIKDKLLDQRIPESCV